MLKKQLLEIIQNGESSGVEFKRDDIRPEQLARELVAFSNLKGGMVILGINDNGEILGINRTNIEEWAMNIGTTLINPSIIPFYEELIVEGKKLAVIKVDMGVAKPYALKEGERLSFYIRVGNTNRLVDRDQLRRLFQSSLGIHYEITPVGRAEFNELDFMRIRYYFNKIRGFTDIPTNDNKEEWTKLLVNNEYMIRTEDGDNVSTIVGNLLFAREPKKFLPQAGIYCVSFKGCEKDYDTKERTVLDLPGVGNFSEENARLISGGLIEETLLFAQRHLSSEELDGARRVRVWEIPPEVLREAICNAIAHRDYTIATEIEFYIFEDRVEIISPGMLPNTVNVERMKAGCRVARNPILMQSLRDYGYVEHMGMGVRNKIIRGMLEFNKSEPGLFEDETSFKVVLWKKKRTI